MSENGYEAVAKICALICLLRVRTASSFCSKSSTNTMRKLQQARSLSVPSRECAHTRMKRPENGPAKMDEMYDPKMDELEREQEQRM